MPVAMPQWAPMRPIPLRCVNPEFNRGETSFYDIRVLEIPTSRHQVFDAVALGMDPKDAGFTTAIQERAYSTPTWYVP
jgi:Protein of unknown function (DUF3604)